MPQVFAYVGAYLMMETGAMALGAFILGNAAIIATTVLLVGGMAYSASKARQAKQQAKDAYNAAQVDRLVNVSSAIAPRELVMGRVRKGGTILYKGSTGQFQKDFYMVVALAGHEIDAVEQIWLNDQLVTLDVDGDVVDAPYAVSATQTATASTGAGTTVTLPASYVAGSISATAPVYRPAGSDGTDSWYEGYIISPVGVTVSGLTATAAVAGATVTYQYTNAVSNVRITAHLGQPGQAADATLVAAFPADWTAADTLQGVAYLVAKFTYSENSFPSGLPNITATIRGAKLYDPRTGVTQWSENPALMLRHVYAHPKFGKAAVTASEDTRMAVAANACDITGAYAVGSAGTLIGQVVNAISRNAPLYRASLVLPYGAAARSGLDDLAQSMGGSWAHMGGELFVKAGVYTAPVLTLTDNDLAVVQRNGATESQRPISIGVHRERAQKYNTVKVKIWDQAQEYKQVSLTPLVGAALLTRDGVELVQETTFAAIGYAPQALHVAGIMMRDARDPLVVELPVKLTMYRLEIFDSISVTLPRYGWNAKTFMVLGRSWNADGSLQLTLKETTAAITQMDAGFSAQGFAANTNLPEPWLIEKVGALTVGSGANELIVQQDGTVQSRMRISWAQSTDISVLQAGQIEVQFRLAASDGAWTSLVVPGEETQVVTSDVADRAIYVIRARSKTKLAVSDWNLQTVHQVIGKTEPPSNVSGFTIDGTRLMWQRVTDLDLAGYAIRYQYGSNQEWGTANPMHEGLITDMPYLMKSVPPGTVTILIKAVDTTGNESLSPAYVVIDLGNSLVANVVESKDFRAAGWTGTVSNATVVSGNLQATQSDPAYRADASDFYGTDSGLFYSTNFDGLVWESAGWSPTLAAAGSNMTATWTLTGNAPTIQYRQTGASLFYAADTDPFYGESASRFYAESPPWQSWPGSVVADDQEYQWRVSTSTGVDSGLLSSFTVSVDVPDKLVKLNAVSIAIGGTRLSAVAGQFHVIENIQLTLQGGSTAVSVEITDKNVATGPLITAKNSAGTSVAATIDALIQGY